MQILIGVTCVIIGVFDDVIDHLRKIAFGFLEGRDDGSQYRLADDCYFSVAEKVQSVLY